MSMLIDNLRFASTNESTMTLIMINSLFECYCLEDAFHEQKIKGQTRIPAGTYEITLRKEGRLHDQYKKKFIWHEGMLWIRNIPDFEYVYYHIGNKAEDTEGCPLVGNIAYNPFKQKGYIAESTLAYEKFYKKIVSALHVEQVFTRFHDIDKNFNKYFPNN